MTASPVAAITAARISITGWSGAKRFCQERNTNKAAASASTIMLQTNFLFLIQAQPPFSPALPQFGQAFNHCCYLHPFLPGSLPVADSNSIIPQAVKVNGKAPADTHLIRPGIAPAYCSAFIVKTGKFLQEQG